MEESALTNRELTALIILVFLTTFLLTRPDRKGILKSFRGVLTSFKAPGILVPLLLYVGWISAAIAGASRIGLWDFDLLKTTILWVVLSGLALLVSLNDAIQKPRFFRGAFIKTLGVVAVVEFVAALKSFPLWLEIPGQALAFMLALVGVVAKRDPKQAPALKLANGYLILFGASALIWSAAHLIANWSTLDQGRILREFLLPIWLTPIALLFVYGFAVIAAYQSSFVRMRIWKKRRPLLRQRLAVMLRANGRLRSLRLLAGLGAQRIARTTTFREAWRELGVLRNETRDRVAHEAASKRRLIENAGLVGTDDLGRQLDRREFEETDKALRWLATCQMGHYRNGNQYRADLLRIVEPHFEHDGLPNPHGVELHVHRDRKSWYATRQTISGWWFAIGAAGPPSDQWLYDGQDPPKGFPSDPGWDRFGGGPASVNWD